MAVASSVLIPGSDVSALTPNSCAPDCWKSVTAEITASMVSGALAGSSSEKTSEIGNRKRLQQRDLLLQCFEQIERTNVVSRSIRKKLGDDQNQIAGCDAPHACKSGVGVEERDVVGGQLAVAVRIERKRESGIGSNNASRSDSTRPTTASNAGSSDPPSRQPDHWC